jgi:hypothetical protein
MKQDDIDYVLEKLKVIGYKLRIYYLERG